MPFVIADGHDRICLAIVVSASLWCINFVALVLIGSLRDNESDTGARIDTRIIRVGRPHWGGLEKKETVSVNGSLRGQC